jgi:hypothetical protein
MGLSPVPTCIVGATRLALDSDARATNQFRYVDTAMPHARFARIPPHRV